MTPRPPRSLPPAGDDPAGGPGPAPARVLDRLVFQVCYPGRRPVGVDLSRSGVRAAGPATSTDDAGVDGGRIPVASPGTPHDYVRSIRSVDAFFAGRVGEPARRTLEMVGGRGPGCVRGLVHATARRRGPPTSPLQAVTFPLREARTRVGARSPGTAGAADGGRAARARRRPAGGRGPRVAEDVRVACGGDHRVSAAPDRGGGRRGGRRLGPGGGVVRAQGDCAGAAGPRRRLSRAALRAAGWTKPKAVNGLNRQLDVRHGAGVGDGTAADCKNPARGWVELEYLKRCQTGQEWGRMRVRDGSAATPGG